MLIYRLQGSDLILVGDDSDANLALLVAQDGVADAFFGGHCAVVSREWVIPHVVTVADAAFSDAADLTWSSKMAESAKQIEYTITARRGGAEGPIVKQSTWVQLLTGHERSAPEDHLIATTKGPMFVSDLIFKSPQPGVTEYWLPSLASPVSPIDRVETEVLADGTLRYLELVHRSAVASSG